MPQSNDKLWNDWTAAREALQHAELNLKNAMEKAIEAKIQEVIAEFEMACERDGQRSKAAVREVHAKIQFLRNNQHFISPFLNAPLDVSRRKRLFGF